MTKVKSTEAKVHVTRSPVAFPTTSLEPKPVYSMVTIYENPTTEIRAKNFGENLMQELGDAKLWTCDAWKMTLLDVADVRRAATEAAAVADVIILALDGHAELPDSTKAWMEQWGARLFDASPILIALFSVSDSRRGVVHSTMDFLGTFSETCGLTLLHTLGESVVAYQPER
jgi:hypothetical protein